VVAGAAPTPEARKLEPSLEDAYLDALTNQRNGHHSGTAPRPPSSPSTTTRGGTVAAR